MAANKVTYSDKVGVNPKETHINQVWDDDMNELKLVVNDNADLFDTLETEVDANTLDIIDIKSDRSVLSKVDKGIQWSYASQEAEELLKALLNELKELAESL